MAEKLLLSIIIGIVDSINSVSDDLFDNYLLFRDMSKVHAYFSSITKFY